MGSFTRFDAAVFGFLGGLAFSVLVAFTTLTEACK